MVGGSLLQAVHAVETTWKQKGRRTGYSCTKLAALNQVGELAELSIDADVCGDKWRGLRHHGGLEWRARWRSRRRQLRTYRATCTEIVWMSPAVFDAVKMTCGQEPGVIDLSIIVDIAFRLMCKCLHVCETTGGVPGTVEV